MAVKCPNLIARDECGAVNTSRYALGRSGYNGAPIPQAIVIHPLVGISAEGYNDQLTNPLPKFLCPIPDPICSVFPNTVNPKSVHFLITPTAAIQYIEITSTAFGIDYFLNPTWGGLSALLPITSINGPFIHIAIEGDCANLLVQIICCIGVELGHSLPIITSSDLQSDRPELILNPSIQSLVDNCIASGGYINPPTIFDLAGRVEALEGCCLHNTSSIISIRSDITTLTQRVYAAEQSIIAINNQISYLQDITSVIPTLVNQITVLTNQVTDILTRCCPTPSVAQGFIIHNTR